MTSKPPAGKELHLVRGRWYGWQMLPGYGDVFFPYFSPIFVQLVLPQKTGRSIFRLIFTNIGYAEGVQGFELDLRILEHQREYMIVALECGSDGHQDRCAVISHLNYQWLHRFCPQYLRGSELDADADISQYLDEICAGNPWLDEVRPN